MWASVPISNGSEELEDLLPQLQRPTSSFQIVKKSLDLILCDGTPKVGILSLLTRHTIKWEPDKPSRQFEVDEGHFFLSRRCRFNLSLPCQCPEKKNRDSMQFWRRGLHSKWSVTQWHHPTRAPRSFIAAPHSPLRK